jgi:hypothetical protein
MKIYKCINVINEYTVFSSIIICKSKKDALITFNKLLKKYNWGNYEESKCLNYSNKKGIIEISITRD